MVSRYTHIDIAKGIGILLIVLGHNYVFADKNGELLNILYSFHVPLFIFLSGIFPNPDYTLKRYTIKRADSYLKPYFAILILLGTIIIPLEDINPIRYLASILYGTGSVLSMGWVPLWFLPHLFAVSVFSYLCLVKMHFLSQSLFFKATFLIIIFSAGVIGIDVFWNIPMSGTNVILPGLPFSIDLLLVSSSYFLLGAVSKREVLDLQFNWRIFVFAAVIFALIHFQFNYTIDLNMRRFDNIIICAIESLAGIYIVLSISRILQNMSMISNILSKIGSASLFILIFHNYVQLQTIHVLKASLTGSKYIVLPAIAFVSFTLAVLVPILLYEIVKRHPFLRILLLPITHN